MHHIIIGLGFFYLSAASGPALAVAEACESCQVVETGAVSGLIMPAPADPERLPHPVVVPPERLPFPVIASETLPLPEVETPVRSVFEALQSDDYPTRYAARLTILEWYRMNPRLHHPILEQQKYGLDLEARRRIDSILKLGAPIDWIRMFHLIANLAGLSGPVKQAGRIADVLTEDPSIRMPLRPEDFESYLKNAGFPATGFQVQDHGDTLVGTVTAGGFKFKVKFFWKEAYVHIDPIATTKISMKELLSPEQLARFELPEPGFVELRFQLKSDPEPGPHYLHWDGVNGVARAMSNAIADQLIRMFPSEKIALDNARYAAIKQFDEGEGMQAWTLVPRGN